MQARTRGLASTPRVTCKKTQCKDNQNVRVGKNEINIWQEKEQDKSDKIADGDDGDNEQVRAT